MTTHTFFSPLPHQVGRETSWSFMTLILFFSFWPYCALCGILVPQPGIKPAPPALEAWSLNHWTTREVPQLISNPKVRKALIVEMTFESDPRRCMDTHLVQKEWHPERNPMWTKAGIPGLVPPPPLNVWLFCFQVIMNVVQMSLLQVGIFSSTVHFSLQWS